MIKIVTRRQQDYAYKIQTIMLTMMKDSIFHSINVARLVIIYYGVSIQMIPTFILYLWQIGEPQYTQHHHLDQTIPCFFFRVSSR